MVAGKRELCLTIVNSSNELTDVVIDKNFTASESRDQRFRFSMPIAPSSFAYFCINCIIMWPTDLISEGEEFSALQHSWLTGLRLARSGFGAVFLLTEFDLAVGLHKDT